jgi:hypothetical protein
VSEAFDSTKHPKIFYESTCQACRRLSLTLKQRDEGVDNGEIVGLHPSFAMLETGEVWQGVVLSTLPENFKRVNDCQFHLFHL